MGTNHHFKKKVPGGHRKNKPEKGGTKARGVRRWVRRRRRGRGRMKQNVRDNGPTSEPQVFHCFSITSISILLNLVSCSKRSTQHYFPSVWRNIPSFCPCSQCKTWRRLKQVKLMQRLFCTEPASNERHKDMYDLGCWSSSVCCKCIYLFAECCMCL